MIASNFRMLGHALCCLLLTPLTASAQETKEPSFVPLFNGKNLDGWVQVNCAKETFTVRDGMIISTGKPTGVLRTERQYENFILEVEWKHLKPRGNAGIFVWSEGISAPGVPFAKSIEVQVLENEYGNTRGYTTHGDIFPIHGARMTPDHGRGGGRSFPTENRSKPAGNWNKYIIECNDGTIKLSVNGKFVNGGSKANYKKGYICLEAEGSECHFRNLKIKELPATGADESNTAPLAEGFISLYSGVDLRGWKVSPEVTKAWKSNDWRLVLKPSGDKPTHLESEAKYTTYSLQLDYKWDDNKADPSRAPVILGGNKTWGLKEVPAEMKTALAKLKPGKFHRLRIDRGRKTQTIILNGVVIVQNIEIERAAREPIVLQDAGTPATFASIYVLEK